MGAAITKMVQFVTVYLLFQIGRWFILPSLGFQYHFKNPVIVILWQVLLYLCNMIFHWVVALLFAIYVVWWIIKTYFPEYILFLPFRSMFLAITPFPPLTDAGILPLYDNLVHILISGDDFKTRLIRFGKAVTGFLMQGSGWITGGLPQRLSEEGQQPKQTQSPQSQSSEAAVVTPPSMDQLQVQNEYLQCVEENTLPIDPAAAAWTDKVQLQINNNNTNMQCRLQSLQSLSNILSLKV